MFKRNFQVMPGAGWVYGMELPVPCRSIRRASRGAKAPLADYYGSHKKWPPSLADMLPQPGGKYVQSVAITKGAGAAGEIELTATLKTEGVDRRVAGKSVRMLTADGGKSWACRAGTVPEKTLPLDCRASQ